MSELGRYRRLYTRLWVHPAFVAMKAPLRLLCLYLLTGPQQNRLGFARFSVATAIEDTHISVKVFRDDLETVCTALGWRFDPDARVLLIPSWWKFNEPTNAKHMKGCLSDLADVPDTPLLADFARCAERLPPALCALLVARVRERIGKGIDEPIGKGIGKPIGYQEQERELRQEQEHEERTAAPPPHSLVKASANERHARLSREPAEDGNYHVIVKLAHVVMDETGLGEPSDPDLVEALKQRCAEEGIDYGRDPAVKLDVVHRALNAAFMQRLPGLARGHR